MRGRNVARATLLALFVTPLLSRALDVPPLTGRIVDLANVIPADREDALTQELQQLESTDSTQVVLLTIPSLEGEAPEAYSLRVAEKWQIGHKGSDNGVLLMVAMAEHDIRIEVGYGLEGRLPDITAGRIIRNEMVPLFKQGDYAGGIERGVHSIIGAVRGEYQTKGEPTGSLSKEGPGAGFLIFLVGSLIVSAIGALVNRLLGGTIGAAAWLLGGFLFLGMSSWLMILLLAPVLFGAGMISPELARIALTSGRGGGGGGGGGGFSGGGGSFGGGGASGKW